MVSQQEVLPSKVVEHFLSLEQEAWLVDVKDDFDNSLRDQVVPIKKEKTVEEGEQSQVQELMGEVRDFRNLASKDRLTYLENRRSLFTKGTEYFFEAEAKKSTISVVSLDIDFFKAFNEISHTFGDLALQTLSNVLLESTKNSGFSVRLGGEEIFLLVEKEMSQDDITKRVNNILRNVRLAFNDLFTMVDEEKDEAGATRDFLEDVILKESRNRKGFNGEYKNKESFKEAKHLIRKIGVNDFEDDIEPADFVLMIKDLIKNEKDDDKLNELQAVREILNFEIGTVTAGLIHVDFEEESKISLEDMSEFVSLIEDIYSEDKEKASLFVEKIKGKSYRQVYLQLFEEAEGVDTKKADQILKFVENNGKKRFGRLVDTVNEVVEVQKAKQRNSIAIETRAAGEFDKKGDKALDEYIVGNYRKLKKELDGLVNDKVRQAKVEERPLVPDYMAIKFEKVRSMLSQDVYKDDLNAILSDLISLQRERYYDALTLVHNYDYLIQIVPQELAKAKEDNFEYSVVSFDLDNLKAINDTWGHKLGDVSLMVVGAVFQQELGNLPQKLQEKIEKTGLKPAVIRATGGEEFIMTLPGLSSSETQEVFDMINGKLKETMVDILDKEVRNTKKGTKNTKTYSEGDEEVVDGEKYIEKIKEFLVGLPFMDSDGNIVERNDEEISKIGTATAGIVSLSEVIDQVVEENGWINSGKMRQLADSLGESLKKQVRSDGSSGRGSSWTFSDFKKGS